MVRCHGTLIPPNASPTTKRWYASTDATSDVVRAFAEEPQAAARYGAVLAILGFLDIPLNHLAVQWWRTLHQPPSVLRPGGPDGTIPPMMLAALLVAIVAFTLLVMSVASWYLWRLGNEEPANWT